MRFRTFMLFVLLFSQPLAAFDLNCGMPVHDNSAGAAVGDEHCSGHANAAEDSVVDDSKTSHQQVSDQHQHPAGHAATGGHCQFCAAGACMLPVMTLGVVAPLAGTLTLPIAEPAPQFQARPLFRPPIL